MLQAFTEQEYKEDLRVVVLASAALISPSSSDGARAAFKDLYDSYLVLAGLKQDTKKNKKEDRLLEDMKIAKESIFKQDIQAKVGKPLSKENEFDLNLNPASFKQWQKKQEITK